MVTFTRIIVCLQGPCFNSWHRFRTTLNSHNVKSKGLTQVSHTSPVQQCNPLKRELSLGHIPMVTSNPFCCCMDRKSTFFLRQRPEPSSIHLALERLIFRLRHGDKIENCVKLLRYRLGWRPSLVG